MDCEYDWFDKRTGFEMAIPADLVGRERRSRCPGVRLLWPVMAGMKESAISSSNGWNNLDISGVVRIKWFQRGFSPCIKAEYDACGYFLPNCARVVTSLVHWAIFSSEYSLIDDRVPINAPRCLFPAEFIFISDFWNKVLASSRCGSELGAALRSGFVL